MQSALHSAMGLPSRSISASWMLGLLNPPEVRSSFIVLRVIILLIEVDSMSDLEVTLSASRRLM